MRNQDTELQFINEYFGENFPGFTGEESYFQKNGGTLSGTIPNHSFEGTAFDYNYQNNTLLHFTKLCSLKAIVESASIRLSSFNSFADTREFIHAAEHIFNIPQTELQEIKDNIFAFSMTHNNGIINSESYDYHWISYGNQNKGVALEFKINTTPIPFGYFLSKVQYHNEISREEKINRLKENYFKCFPKSTSYKPLLGFLLPLFCSFKPQHSGNGELYERENEVRLLYHEDTPEGFFFWNQITKPQRDGKTNLDIDPETNLPTKYYHSIPLSFPNDSIYSLLKLTKIHFGKKLFEGHEMTTNIVMQFIVPLCEEKGIAINFN